MHLPSTLKRITYKTAPYITTLHAKLIYQVMLVSSFSPPLDRISFQCIWSQLILLKSSSDLSLARYYSATINSFKSLPRFLVPVTSTSPYHPKISFIPSMHFYDDFFTRHIIPSSVFTLASHSSYSTPIMLLYSFYLLPYLNWGNFGLSLTSIYYKFGKDLFHPSLYSLNKYFLQSAKLSVHQQFFSLARFYSWVSHFLLPFLQVCIPNYLKLISSLHILKIQIDTTLLHPISFETKAWSYPSLNATQRSQFTSQPCLAKTCYFYPLHSNQPHKLVSLVKCHCRHITHSGLQL